MGGKRKPKPTLTAAEKRERDARATYWMNQRKIERVAEAAARSGWHSVSAEGMMRAIAEGAAADDETGQCYISTEDASYRVVDFHGDRPGKEFTLRRVR